MWLKYPYEHDRELVAIVISLQLWVQVPATLKTNHVKDISYEVQLQRTLLFYPLKVAEDSLPDSKLVLAENERGISDYVRNRDFNPLTGYLPPEKLFRKRLTLILRFPSKMQQTFSFPPFRTWEVERGQFYDPVGPFVNAKKTRQTTFRNCLATAFHTRATAHLLNDESQTLAFLVAPPHHSSCKLISHWLEANKLESKAETSRFQRHVFK
ncbi:hypothetical protein TNCV_2504721 [Trichonephila clavipes]|uniref:Uncharacterized protein n=1 Tax=Trichonephila clavipes TaxID=2585209 RepID=A0A8X6WGZ3_TRICX|nr:hypothetical protein TNCV_2504721 [Trichonephila clavipes]